MKARYLICFLLSFLISIPLSSLESQAEDLPSLILDYPKVVNESMTFSISVRNETAPLANATVLFLDQTNLTNKLGIAYLVAPRVQPEKNTTLPLIVRKEGYNDTTALISILNVPQLFVSVVDSYIRENTSFFVTVIDENASVIENATVTFNTTSILTNGNGTALFHTPLVSKKTNMTVTVTKSGYLGATIYIVIYPGLTLQNLVGFLLVIGILICISLLLIIYGVERYLRHRRFNKPR